jgi:hypothetical protein
MKTLINQMMNQLSEEDQSIFSELAIKLNQLKGDVSQLSESDLKIISDMENKYTDKLSSFDDEVIQNQTILDDQTEEPASETNLVETAFAVYVKQLLARDLNSQFPKEEDAIKFAFQNKWIAQDLKEVKKAEDVFDLYKNDIGNANQWRESTVGIDADKSMAVGMTWFMVVFALYKQL